MRKFLRCLDDGHIFGYSAQLARNPKVEVITEKEAYPERFMNKKTKARVAKKAAGEAPSLNEAALEVPEGEAPNTTPPELAAEAGAGLPQ